MPAQAKSASPSIASNEDVEIQAESMENESTPLLSDQTVEEASVKSGPIWSPSSLGPGFIWIQAGPFPPQSLIKPGLTPHQQSSATSSSPDSTEQSQPQPTP